MSDRRLWKELERRNVFRVAAAYVVTAWLLIQVAETVFPAFGLGTSAIRLVIIVLAIGLVPTVIFAWAFELTPEGVKRDKDVDPAKSITPATGKKLDRAIFVVLALAISYFAFDKFILDPARDARDIESARSQGRSEALVATFGERSIAVLPFADLSPDGDQAYFSEGVSEELLNLLSGIPQLRITSRSSAAAVKGKDLSLPEIAEQLQVAYVLDGAVRKSGDRLRISTQLIEARSDTQLWSKKFDRTLDDIFAIQDEIADDVVEQVKGTLLIEAPQQRVIDPQAYTLFLQARHQRRLGTAESYEQAISLYQRSLEIDPDNPAAWDGLATVYQNQAVTGLRPPAEGFQLAKDAARSALAVDPEYGPAYGSLGFNAQYYQTDLKEAAKHYERALQYAPGNAGLVGSAGLLLLNIGRTEEGIKALQFLAARDPVSPAAYYLLGIAYLSAQQPAKAMAALDTMLTLSPDFAGGHYMLGVAHLLAGDPERARQQFELERKPGWRLFGLAMAHFDLARRGEDPAANNAASEQALARLIEEFGAPVSYNIAYVQAYRGEPDSAFEWLEKAIEVQDPGISEAAKEPLFANLHDDPRWPAFLRKIGYAKEDLAAIEFELHLPDSE